MPLATFFANKRTSSHLLSLIRKYVNIILGNHIALKTLKYLIICFGD